MIVLNFVFGFIVGFGIVLTLQLLVSILRDRRDSVRRKHDDLQGT